MRGLAVVLVLVGTSVLVKSDNYNTPDGCTCTCPVGYKSPLLEYYTKEYVAGRPWTFDPLRDRRNWWDVNRSGHWGAGHHYDHLQPWLHNATYKGHWDPRYGAWPGAYDPARPWTAYNATYKGQWDPRYGAWPGAYDPARPWTAYNATYKGQWDSRYGAWSGAYNPARSWTAYNATYRGQVDPRYGAWPGAYDPTRPWTAYNATYRGQWDPRYGAWSGAYDPARPWTAYNATYRGQGDPRYGGAWYARNRGNEGSWNPQWNWEAYQRINPGGSYNASYYNRQPWWQWDRPGSQRGYWNSSWYNSGYHRGGEWRPEYWAGNLGTQELNANVAVSKDDQDSEPSSTTAAAPSTTAAPRTTASAPKISSPNVVVVSSDAKPARLDSDVVFIPASKPTGYTTKSPFIFKASWKKDGISDAYNYNWTKKSGFVVPKYVSDQYAAGTESGKDGDAFGSQSELQAHGTYSEPGSSARIETSSQTDESQGFGGLYQGQSDAQGESHTAGESHDHESTKSSGEHTAHFESHGDPAQTSQFSHHNRASHGHGGTHEGHSAGSFSAQQEHQSHFSSSSSASSTDGAAGGGEWKLTIHSSGVPPPEFLNIAGAEGFLPQEAIAAAQSAT